MLPIDSSALSLALHLLSRGLSDGGVSSPPTAMYRRQLTPQRELTAPPPEHLRRQLRPQRELTARPPEYLRRQLRAQPVAPSIPGAGPHQARGASGTAFHVSGGIAGVGRQ